MGNNTRKPTKYVAVITYCIALVCLLLGLFLPLGNVVGVTGKSSIMALQLPNALGVLFGKSWGSSNPFTYNFGIKFNGWGKAFDLGAIFVLAYVIITAIGVIMLIPVIAGSKKRHTSLKVASVVECLALIVLTVLVLMQLEAYLTTIGGIKIFKWSYALTIAVGGTLLMLIVQAIITKKGSGVIKFVLFLLSCIAVIGTIYPVTLLIPKLGDMFGKFSGGEHKIAAGLIGATTGGEALANLQMLFISKYTLVGSTSDKLIQVLLLVTALLVILNFILDMIGMGKKTTKGMLICNLIRYLLEVACVVTLLAMAIALKNYSCGIFLYILVAIAVIQLIIEIIRLAIFKPHKKTVKQPKPEPVKEEKVKEEKVKEDKKSKKEEAAEAVKEEPVVEQPEPVYYTPGPIYNGPTDEFIKTLSNEEKIEFSKLFIERRAGEISYIPAYEVGAANPKFFSAIFIYYGRVRPLMSDGLINKIYEYINLMN